MKGEDSSYDWEVCSVDKRKCDEKVWRLDLCGG